jgi:hypothetical protein
MMAQLAQHDGLRQIRYQSAEQDNAEESPSRIDLLDDEIGCLRHRHLIQQCRKMRPAARARAP